MLTTLIIVAATIAGGAAPASAGRTSTSTPVVHKDRIAFSAYHGGVQQVFTMNEDGTGKTQITFNKTGDKKCDPTLSPSGLEVAYASNDGGMYVHTIGGSALNVAPPVVPGMGRGGGRRPAWSPDGNTLVFGYSTNLNAGVTPTEDLVFDLWMISRAPNGPWPTQATRLTNVKVGASALQPRFNSEGTWISYTFRDVNVPSAEADLYVAPVPLQPTLRGDLESGAVGHVLMGKVGAYLSTWRSDSSQIAFVKSCTGGIHLADVTYVGGTPTEAAVSGPPLVASGGCGLSFSRSNANKLTYADSSKIYVVTHNNSVWGTPVSIGIGSQPSW